jgi:hypothetical protein
MELSVTIELHEEEMRKFDEFIEDGCFDKTKYLKKMLRVGILQAAGAPKRRRIRGIYKTERRNETETEGRETVTENQRDVCPA